MRPGGQCVQLKQTFGNGCTISIPGGFKELAEYVMNISGHSQPCFGIHESVDYIFMCFLALLSIMLKTFQCIYSKH